MNLLLKALLKSAAFILPSLLNTALASDTKVAGTTPEPAHQKNTVENLDPAIQRECKNLEKVKFPASDRPTAEHEKNLKACDTEDLYYGIGTKIDYTNARYCAFSKRNRDQLPNYGILMMLYANGQDIARNYKLAKKAACNTGAAPMEIGGWVQHLTNMESGDEGANPKIDLCDDTTSGFMQTYCAGIQSRLADQAREKDFERLTSSWRSSEHRAFQKLKKQANIFIDTRSTLEIDQNGTARGADILEEASLQKEDLLASLRDFEAGNLPMSSKSDFTEFDRELNHVYMLLKRRKNPEFSTVKMVDIKRTQRVWLAYRDAWVTFGNAKYPSVPAYAWKAYFTKKRTEMLKALLADRE